MKNEQLKETSSRWRGNKTPESDSEHQPVHILEVGGRGGVFQHSLAVSITLTEAGHDVTIHTASDVEIEDERVALCRCFSWKRDVTNLRGLRITLRYLLRTLPHLLRLPGVFWVQGLFKTPLTLLTLILRRLVRTAAIFSPHTLFTRHGGKLDQFFIDRCLTTAGQVVTYNKDDAAKLIRNGVKQTQLPLLMYTPVVRQEVLDRWKIELESLQANVCSVGQIRADKNLTMLVQAAVASGTSLIIMGPDTGSAAEIREKISELKASNVSLFEGYYPLEDMAAVIGLTGTVALPYTIASQSAVAVLAKAYGAKVLACEVGGLTDQADITVPSLSVSDWTLALSKVPKYRNTQQVAVPQPSTLLEREQLTNLMLGACR